MTDMQKPARAMCAGRFHASTGLVLGSFLDVLGSLFDGGLSGVGSFLDGGHQNRIV